VDDRAGTPGLRISTRAAKAGDAERLAVLSGILQRQHAAQHPEIFKPFDQAAGIDFFHDQLGRPGAVILVAEAARTAVGYLMAEVVTHEDTPFTNTLTALHIQHLVVDEGFRGQGVGQALLTLAEQIASRHRCDVLQLACWSFNEAAQTFFTAHGFAPYQVRMTRPAH
jgi:ribosomal protein S18 acetylase RimI-like enzyme